MVDLSKATCTSWELRGDVRRILYPVFMAARNTMGYRISPTLIYATGSLLKEALGSAAVKSAQTGPNRAAVFHR